MELFRKLLGLPFALLGIGLIILANAIAGVKVNRKLYR